MTWLICLVTIHTSADRFDNRQFLNMRGYVMREGTEFYKVNFYDDFKKKGVDLNFNRTVQLMKDHDCHVERP